MIGIVLLLPLLLLLKHEVTLGLKLVLYLPLELFNALIDMLEIGEVLEVAHEKGVEQMESCLSFQPALDGKRLQHHLLHVLGYDLLLRELQLQLADSQFKGILITIVGLEEGQALFKSINDFIVV